jgi:flagellar biosynthesis/type III secretory pathway chaperone
VREEIEKEALALMETLNRVASLNRSNAELIKEATQFVNYNINLMTSGERENIYSERGKMKSAEQKVSGFLNRQV